MKGFSLLALVAVVNGVTIQDDFYVNNSTCTGNPTQHIVSDYSKCTETSQTPVPTSVIQAPGATCKAFVTLQCDSPDCTGTCAKTDPINYEDGIPPHGICKVYPGKQFPDSQMVKCFE